MHSYRLVERGMSMANFALTCCSTADYPKSFFDERQIGYACFHWNESGVDHLDDLYQSISPEEFFANISAGAMPTTSQVGIGEYVALWRPILENGSDILHLTLSSGISGTYGSAVLAAQEMAQEFPDRKVVVIDSLAASAGFGLLVDYVADMRDAGATLEEAEAWVYENRLKVHHWFFSTDLTSFIRGGRVSKVSGFFGTALKICPLLSVDREGKLVPREKIRTKKRAEKEMLARMVEHAQNGTGYSGKCAISQSDCRSDAEDVRDMIEEQFPALKGKVLINDIGTVIGSHTGPGTVALFFMGDERE